jgi:excisionase family DNA binding protein
MKLEAEPLLTVAEAAVMLNVGRTLLYKLMYRGDLPYVRIGRTRRVHMKDLIDLISRSRIGGRYVA